MLAGEAPMACGDPVARRLLRQHRERAAARSRPARHRARPGRGRARSVQRDRPSAVQSPDRRRHVLDARDVRGSRRHSAPPDRRSESQAGGLRRPRLGLVILAKYVLDGLGLDQERDFQAVYLDRAGDGPAMVLDGRAAALWGGGQGWPGFGAVAKGSAGARFIAPTGDEIARILARHTSSSPMTVPAGAYPGLAAPLDSVGSWSFILARPDLPDDVTYRLAQALHRGEAALARRLPQAQETTAANTLAAAPHADLIHRGVLRFLREIGLAR